MSNDGSSTKIIDQSHGDKAVPEKNTDKFDGYIFLHAS
jgi:hypothetical protein